MVIPVASCRGLHIRHKSPTRHLAQRGRLLRVALLLRLAKVEPLPQRGRLLRVAPLLCLAKAERRSSEGQRDYLSRAGAGRRYPGIDVGVRVDPVGRSVTVRLQAPLDLPLVIPGSPANPVVGASSTAAVTVR